MLIIIIIGKCNYDDAQSRSKYMGEVGRLRFARKPICVIGESLKYNLLEIYMIGESLKYNLLEIQMI